MLRAKAFSVGFSIACCSQSRAASSGKPKVVVVGSGWGGGFFLKKIDPSKCELTVLTARNHMVFTPMLPAVAVGTLEARSISEATVRIRPELGKAPHKMLQTQVCAIDFATKAIKCCTTQPYLEKPSLFDVPYDYLVLSHGADAATFNVPGVLENAFFLRELPDATAIRRRLLHNLKQAQLPSTTPEERKALLQIIIVGGGPIGVEFAGSLTEFIGKDVAKVAPSLRKEFKVTLAEAFTVLGPFDPKSREYGVQSLKAEGVDVIKAAVKNVAPDSVTLGDGSVIKTRLVVWGAGVAPTQLNKRLTNVDKNKQGRLSIDDRCRLLSEGKPIKNVFAFGDCAASVNNPLPTLAAVACRQGSYCATALNGVLAKGGDVGQRKPFAFSPNLSMVSLGHGKGIIEVLGKKRSIVTGKKAWFLWRAIYSLILFSSRCRLYVLSNWFTTMFHGRDLTLYDELHVAKAQNELLQKTIEKMETKKTTKDGKSSK